MTDKRRKLAEWLGFTDISYTGIEIDGYKVLYVRTSEGRIQWCPEVILDNTLGDGGPGTLAGEMRKKELYLTLEQFSKGWNAEFCNEEDENLGMAWSDLSPAEAIYNAAYAVYEAEIKGKEEPK